MCHVTSAMCVTVKAVVVNLQDSLCPEHFAAHPTASQVNLLNFMATQEGLEDQMLGITVAREEAELESRREQLVLEDAENKRVQKEIEDTILDLLKNSEGNILDDEVS